MSEPATNPEGDPPTASGPGAPDDGSGGTGQAAGGTPPAGPSADELRRREVQSALDKERAKTAALEAQLAAAGGTQDGAVMTPDQMRAQIRAEVARERSLLDVADRSRTDYRLASDAIRQNALNYDSPEEFELALKLDHEQRSADEAAIAERVAAQVREEYGARLGAAPQEGGGPPAPTNALTVAMVTSADGEDLLAMSDADLKALAHSLPEE